MDTPQTLYEQSATHFAMPLYLRRETEVEPQLIADLAEYFLSNRLFPGGGLLITATDTPLPEDTEERRAKFLQLDDALRPAFLSRDEVTEMKRGMLGYFYRERPPLR